MTWVTVKHPDQSKPRERRLELSAGSKVYVSGGNKGLFAVHSTSGLTYGFTWQHDLDTRSSFADIDGDVIRTGISQEWLKPRNLLFTVWEEEEEEEVKPPGASRKRKIYSAMVNMDPTEGKGPMGTIGLFFNEDDAEAAVQGMGVMGVGDGVVEEWYIHSSYDAWLKAVQEKYDSDLPGGHTKSDRAARWRSSPRV